MPKLFRKLTTRWVLDGKQVPANTPGAKKVRERSKKWYARINHRDVPLSANKSAAQIMCNDLVRKAELAKAGVVDPHEAGKKKPLLGHLRDYETALHAAGDTEEHVKRAVSNVKKVLAACRFVFVTDLSASAVAAALARERKEGKSVRTTNHRLVSVKAFAAWMEKDGRIAASPLRHLAAGNVHVDRRHSRRALTPDEAGRLLAAAKGSLRVICGNTGFDRYAVYLTALGTGFRANELASLTPESFRLDDEVPVITLSARVGKNRRLVHQPIGADLVAVLREYLKGRPAGVPVWHLKGVRTAEMLRHDLEDAGIEYVVEGPDGPEYADFHALRHTYITSLERAGVSIKTAMMLARHSDPKLTLNVYTHRGLVDLAAAVEQLPRLESAPPRSGGADFVTERSHEKKHG
jgi:integrase